MILNAIAEKLKRQSKDDFKGRHAAFEYLKERRADAALTAGLRALEPQRFCNQVPFMAHLADKGIDIFDRQEIGSHAEAGLWGSIRHHGLMGNTVIVSDDAGQFRFGNHALCWVHAERLLQKLMPGTAKEEQSLTMVRDLVWRSTGAESLQAEPFSAAVPAFQRRFDRIFSQRTGYEALDKLFARLLRRKTELLNVLDHPEIPLHTNASENDLRSFVTKRKISGGTISRDGRVARDVMLGLMKTCQKLGLSFCHYLGDRLGIVGPGVVSPLATMIAARA